MTHIYLSNRLVDVRYGSSGKPVAGSESSSPTRTAIRRKPGEIGDLYVSGPTSALLIGATASAPRDLPGPGRAAATNTCRSRRLRMYAGRSDDMLKVSGQYVSRSDRAALMTHGDVLEAPGDRRAGQKGSSAKPISTQGQRGGDGKSASALGEGAAAQHSGDVAPFKYPRWVESHARAAQTATARSALSSCASSPSAGGARPPPPSLRASEQSSRAAR